MSSRKEIKKYFREIVRGERPAIDMWHYLLGNYRYKLFYNRNYYTTKHPLMRRHIWEQIQFRIKVMARGCYLAGSCEICGCHTTQLQMADKPCEKPCYPSMLNKKNWESWKVKGVIYDRQLEGWWIFSEATGHYILHKEDATSIAPTETRVKITEPKKAKVC